MNWCRVCGLEQDQPPWGDDGMTPSFDICSCCGVEFGYEDATLQGTQTYRQSWMSKGAPWFDPKLKPHEWNLEAQLQYVPSEYK